MSDEMLFLVVWGVFIVLVTSAFAILMHALMKPWREDQLRRMKELNLRAQRRGDPLPFPKAGFPK